MATGLGDLDFSEPKQAQDDAFGQFEAPEKSKMEELADHFKEEESKKDQWDASSSKL